jgi:hypothetical protein
MTGDAAGASDNDASLFARSFNAGAKRSQRCRARASGVRPETYLLHQGNDEMKQILTACLLSGFLAFAACGCDSGGNENIMENADQSALEEYEAMVAADEAAMSAQPDDASDDQ